MSARFIAIIIKERGLPCERGSLMQEARSSSCSPIWKLQVPFVPYTLDNPVRSLVRLFDFGPDIPSSLQSVDIIT